MSRSKDPDGRFGSHEVDDSRIRSSTIREPGTWTREEMDEAEPFPIPELPDDSNAEPASEGEDPAN